MSSSPDTFGASPMAAGRHARRRPARRRRAGPISGLLLGAAGSTLTTAVAAAVAGYQADRVLQPVEFTLRVGLLLAAPCVGAFVAATLLPRSVVKPPAWTIGVGAVAGPIIALRLDRVRAYGTSAVLLTLCVIAAWALIATSLAAAARRSDPDDRVEVEFPPPRPHDDDNTPAP